MEKVIVVGYIPTPEGEAALERAILEAKKHEAKLVAINVQRAGVYMDERTVQTEDREGIKVRLEASGVPFEMIRPEYGAEATDTILEVCRERHAEMVVIGLRRRSAVSKLILGSVAQQILLHADCPILAVRA